MALHRWGYGLWEVQRVCEDFETRMGMVRSFVGDVNGMDRKVGEPDSWGTPLWCYAAKTRTTEIKEDDY